MWLKHRIEHWLGWNTGKVVSALDKRGTVWIGFRCSQCGKVSGIHASWLEAPKTWEFHD